MVVELIVAALAITAVGTAVGVLRGRRRRPPPPPAPPSLHRQLVAGEILPGDVVVHLGADYLVQGVATFSGSDAGQPILVAAWLTDGSRSTHLLVDLEARPRCVLAERRDASGAASSVPSLVEEGGRELRLARRAAVRFRCAGDAPDLPGEGACELGVYDGPGRLKAAMVLCSRGTLLLAGEAVNEEALQLLPGGSAAGGGEAA